MAPKGKQLPNDDFQQDLLDRITKLTEKIETMDSHLLALTKEKDTLAAKVQDQAEEIADLRNALNDREQYGQNWSMRCLNLPVPAQSESDTRVVMQCLYDSLLYPILEGAKAEGDIASVPGCEQLLETAHILPGKGGAMPVIARFYSRYWRNLIFRHRRNYAPKAVSSEVSSSRAGARSSPRLRYPFFEDLTRASFAKLTAIKNHEEVTAAWTVNGSIRFRIKNSEQIYKVGSIRDTVESIIEK